MTSPNDQCIFCKKIDCKIEKITKYFFIIRDTTYPVTKHHTLIIPNRHVSDYFDLEKKEITELSEILNSQKNELQKLDSKIKYVKLAKNIAKRKVNQSVKIDELTVTLLIYEATRAVTK